MRNSRTLQSILAITVLVVTLFAFCGCDMLLQYIGMGNKLTITAQYVGDTIYVGDSLDAKNIKVTATFVHGISGEKSVYQVYGFQVSSLDTSTAGNKIVQITYTEGGITAGCELTLAVAKKSTTNLPDTPDVVNYGKYGVLSDDGKNVKIANTAKVVDTTDLQIHFLELGNQYTGDCTYIKAGDTDILIDAGSRKGSAGTIASYIDQYCTDGIFEYVIVTHAHQDHIAGFVGTGTRANEGIFSRYECKNIIDFPRTNATSQISKDYFSERDLEIAAGANHYTALECWNNNNESDRFNQSTNATGARRYIKLADNLEMEILYNYYYENKTSNENDYSVCVMVNQYGANYDFENLSNPENESNVNHFLFTGDLEEDGEEYLVANNSLPEVVLFKGGHHGSYTASSDALLNVVQPKVVCICCCAGTQEFGAKPENTFPAQAMLNRVAKHTDLVFATSLWVNKDTVATSLNGNITLTCNNLGVNLTASNNVTMIKDTQWFKDNRICPSEWQ